MKTKVFTVVPVEDYYGFETEKLKSTLRINIDRRLELMKTQRKLVRKPKSQSANRKKAKSSRKNNINPRGIKFISGNPTSDDLMTHINNAMMERLNIPVSKLQQKIGIGTALQSLLLIIEKSFKGREFTKVLSFDILENGNLLEFCLKQVQQTVYEASLEVNKLYRLPMLVIFLEAFLTFTFNLYFMLCVMADPKKFKLPQLESMGFLSQHLIQPSVCVTILVVAFTTVRNEFKKSQSFVNKIIIHAIDRNIKRRFSEFSQQIESNNPHFHVFEFFVLDGSVIFSMISSAATYLIILIQAMANETEENPLFQIVTNSNGSA